MSPHPERCIDPEKQVLEALESLGLNFAKRDHPPVATVEEAVRHWEGIPGAHCKNLFLRNKKGWSSPNTCGRSTSGPWPCCCGTIA
jgi:hypothetical protein